MVKPAIKSTPPMKTPESFSGVVTIKTTGSNMPTLEEVKDVLERDTVAGFNTKAFWGSYWLWLQYEPSEPRYYLEYPDCSVSPDYDELQEAYDLAKDFIKKNGGLAHWE